MNESYLGYQKTIDFYGCNAQMINSCQFIEETLLKAAELMNLKVVNTTIHSFSPIGISGVIVIEESHLAVHTWPEHEYVAIDIFTCNKEFPLEKGIAFLSKSFEAKSIHEEMIKRGHLEKIKMFNEFL